MPQHRAGLSLHAEPQVAAYSDLKSPSGSAALSRQPRCRGYARERIAPTVLFIERRNTLSKSQRLIPERLTPRCW